MSKKRIASARMNKELAAWRATLGLNQYQAAELLDVSFRTYQGWELGKPAPRPHIVRLALEHLTATQRRK